MQVSVTRREAEIRLDETEFNSKKMINKRKKLILAGKTEEEADEIIARIEEKNALRLEKRKYAATIEAKGKKRKNDGDEGRLSGGKKKVGDESLSEGKKMKKVGDEENHLSKKGKTMKKTGKNIKKVDDGGGGKKKVSVIVEPIKLGKKKKLKTKMGGTLTTPKVAGKNVKKSSESGSVSKDVKKRNEDLDEIRDLLGI
ncbi:uncharacterized protein LOC113471220 [Diaphorina citri]|uniref:Uncharacterized protein LOC113471220 n=1 Tax=Diaphorina citri TaxID=121845 RepID=A0A3Q0JGZ3_DIACI|nr:uncharacterized protein LOC113471220 [Diaphorina citri]